MSKGDTLKRKLDKKVIQKLGQDVIQYRFDLSTSGNPHYPDTDIRTATDFWGEPIDADGENITTFSENFAEMTLRIVTTKHKQTWKELSIGSLPNEKTGKLLAYVSATADVRHGDFIQYFPDSNKLYQIETIESDYLTGVNVIKLIILSPDGRDFDGLA